MSVKKRKPRVGSVAWDEEQHKDPKVIKGLIEAFRLEAESGKPEAVARLNRWLEDYPEYRSTVPALTDLVVKVEDAWARAVAFGNPMAVKKAKEEAERIKAELLPPDATFIETILASTVAVAYLSHQHAASLASMSTTHAPVRAARDRRMSSAQKRLFDALKGWNALSKLGNSVRVKPLKLYQPALPAAKAG